MLFHKKEGRALFRKVGKEGGKTEILSERKSVYSLCGVIFLKAELGTAFLRGKRNPGNEKTGLRVEKAARTETGSKQTYFPQKKCRKTGSNLTIKQR